ncbi:DUF411 domain-containing protein [Campylobacter mucosalis]|uniref:Putative DUF411 domain protein n=1 Tax=Campylobacter mucosalis CCUG 21559 TaxID=1032067 RepID=A0A6G5QJ90_9BACT|nr:DUF411 domain-containing protein [Campylobacter mucosalis]QCD45682.1 putative DUF411 domain protein [Campylobacter mucosalis CCUG 21559]
MKKTGLALGILCLFASANFASELVEVYKSPTCGCCSKWEEHMRANGFSTKEYLTDATIEVKAKNKVPLELASCHTALVGGYVVEGHVPADEIKRLLALKPEGVIGISTPGMPLESPGMEQGNVPEQYDVVIFKHDGSAEVFATYIGSKKIK